MSGNSKDGSKTPKATIKIASKDAKQRTNSGSSADVGPGDANAEPSQAPELVDIPQPPTASQLVVKSGNSRVIKTIMDPISLRKNSHLSESNRKAAQSGAPASGAPASGAPASGGAQSGGAQSGGAQSGGASHVVDDGGAPRESTSSTLLSRSGSQNRSDKPKSTSASAKGSGASGGSGSKAHFTVKSAGSGVTGPASAGARTASARMQANSQAGGSVHDEVEEGEGEVEQPQESPSPSTSPGASTAPTKSPSSSPSPSASPGPGEVPEESPSGGIDTAPASSGGGASKMSPKTSSLKPDRSGRSSRSGKSSKASSAEASSDHSSEHGAADGKKKKVTKFRYHKRITVRTHGKTSPSTIMDKVAMKEHKAGITPSTIEDMDPQELMKRAGIKSGNKKAHWRVRLRQTKRMTKNGKTIVQTKVAYRDSEGNKRVKTADGPNCKSCGKKLEECKCD